MSFASRFAHRSASLLGCYVLAVSCGGGGNNGGSTATTAPASPVLSSISVSVPGSGLLVGTTVTATASGVDQKGAAMALGSVTWQSSAAAVATVTAAGAVTGVSAGTATISATADGRTGSAVVTVSAPITAVATVTVATPTSTTGTGTLTQLSATTSDATGAALTGRVITWTSSNPAVATVSTDGKLTGAAAGSAIISATSEGKTGTVPITVVTLPAGTILSGVRNAYTFMTTCVTNDPVFAQLRKDFAVLNEGQPFTGGVNCTDPFTTYPAAQITEELLTYQTLRLVYYMSIGTEGKLPWTALSLYDWMKSQIAGVNVVAAPGNSNCCALIGGKKYFTTSRKAIYDTYRGLPGLAAWLALMAHETRHAAGYGHINGCPAFPLPTDALGCDASYDLSNLGAYGIQRWLFAQWATGALNVGIACGSASVAAADAQSMANLANGYRTRFVSGAPADITASAPFGGICYPP